MSGRGSWGSWQGQRAIRELEDGLRPGVVGAVVALVDVAPPESENDEALQLVEDCEHRRHAERQRFCTVELFTDRKLPYFRLG